MRYSYADCVQQKANNHRTKWKTFKLIASGIRFFFFFSCSSSHRMKRTHVGTRHHAQTDKEAKMPFVPRQMNIECHSEFALARNFDFVGLKYLRATQVSSRSKNKHFTSRCCCGGGSDRLNLKLECLKCVFVTYINKTRNWFDFKCS